MSYPGSSVERGGPTLPNGKVDQVKLLMSPKYLGNQTSGRFPAAAAFICTSADPITDHRPETRVHFKALILFSSTYLFYQLALVASVPTLPPPLTLISNRSRSTCLVVPIVCEATCSSDVVPNPIINGTTLGDLWRVPNPRIFVSNETGR